MCIYIHMYYNIHPFLAAICCFGVFVKLSKHCQNIFDTEE